jgi:hypothetical protein
MKNGGWLDSYQNGGDTDNEDYNMKRALELGYTPDETGHWPSVDDETEEWLKSKKHHTRGMEMMAYELNPELRNKYNLIENEKGVLQYVDKKDFKNGGWLDNYGTQENYNDYKVSAPKDFKGNGYSNVGRNYSPAWGGQFQNGGPVKPSQKNYKTQGQYKAALREYELNLRKYELNNNPEKLKGESDKDYENRTKYFKYKVRQQQDKDPITREYLKIKDDQSADFNPVTKTLRQIFTSPVHVGYGIYNAANPKGLDKYKSRATKNNEDLDLGSSILDVRSLLNPFDYGMKAAPLLKQAATRTVKEVAEDQGVDLIKQGNEYINNYQMGGSVYPVNYVPQAAMGASMPGAVGFTYARTKGIPSNGPYAKKTMASAQNGVDMYDNPLIARMINNANIDRSYYDPRLNTMNMGSDYNMWRDEETGEPLTGDDLKYQQDKMLAHENYHAIQHKEGRDNYDIAHSTDNEQWARMQKRPEVMSTDAVWNNFYNRSAIENIQDYANKINEVPEARLINQQLLFDKVLDRERYDNPSNLEGEAKFYEDTGVKFQNGGEMRYYQNGLDWKPKGMKDGGWLDEYDEAQTGKRVLPNNNRALQILANIQKRKQKGEPSPQFSNVKIKDERGEAVKKVDNTSTASKPKFTDLKKTNVRNKTKAELAEQERINDEAIIADRKARMADSMKAQSEDIIGNPNWKEVLARETQSTGDKFRLFPNDPNSFIDDWLNPGVMIGDMASSLGAAPYDMEQQESMMPLMTAIGVPLLTGGLEGIGAKTNRQFINNLVNPVNMVPGYKSVEKSIGKALGTKEGLLSNAYKLNPKALKEAQEAMLVRARPIGQDPYMNMAETLRAKEAAGEQLTWYQKNLLNPQTNPQMAAREKYFGQWFADNPSDLDFYINPGTRNFADNAQIEILKSRMPKSEAAKYNVKNFEDAKTLSNLHDTEYILPKDMVQQAKRYSVDDLPKLMEEYNQINKPHWLKGFPKQEHGGIIKDDMGQWNHPGEITEIGSNQITMQGVPYDVLGISDTGDTKLMKPGKNYKFKGKKVTEFPMAKNGLRQEQKGLVNLDNLLNFTNYNKPQPGGWLDSYK